MFRRFTAQHKTFCNNASPNIIKIHTFRKQIKLVLTNFVGKINYGIKKEIVYE